MNVKRQIAINTEVLRKRLVNDGRPFKEIATSAGLAPQTIYKALEKGYATERTIEKIRKSIRPKMNLGTICLCTNQEPISDSKSNDSIWFDLTAEQQKQVELTNKIYDLCKEYNLVDVFDAVYEIYSTVLSYIGTSGFDLLDLYDEFLKDE